MTPTPSANRRHRPPVRDDGADTGRLPAGLTVFAAVAAALGFHWDIAWHTMFIRDAFLTASHATILCALGLGFVAAEIRRRRSPSDSLLAANRVSPGAFLALISSFTTVAALYFDNWWHTLFGFDVTLWSPPHLLLSLGFLLILVGGVAELVEQKTDPRAVAAIAGLLFGIATLLVFEFELGFAHRDLHWEHLALGAFMGCAFALAAGASRLLWAGTIAAVAALGFRLVGLALNGLVDVALPTPPIGILPAGIVFDLARRWCAGPRIHLRPMVPQTLAWFAMFAGTGVWRALVGRTWWTPAVLPLGLILGLIGTIAGTFIGRYLASFTLGAGSFVAQQTTERSTRWPARPSRRQLLSAVAASLVATALIGVTGLAVLGDTKGVYIQAELTQTETEIRLDVPGAIARDWVTIIGGVPTDAQSAHWLGSLTWENGVFVGPRPDENLDWLGLWYVGDNRAWVSTGSPDTTGTVIFEKDAFREPGRPISPTDVAVSYALILALVTLPIGFIVLARIQMWAEVTT